MNPYIGELRLVAFNFAPRNWALCNGQLMAISQNQPLFSVLGTTYGGDGIRTFGLPQLQGRTPVMMGNGFNPGQMGGEEGHTLTMPEVPPHSHTANAMTTASGAPGGSSPAGNFLAGTTGSLGIYANASQASGALHSQSVSPSGGSQPHENRQPYLVMNWIISLSGIFPSRN
jgi:microcystin-dependent protein